MNAARDLDLTGMTWADAHRTLERLQPAIADLLDMLADHHPVQILGRDQCWKCVGNVPHPCDHAAARAAVAAALTGGTDG